MALGAGSLSVVPDETCLCTHVPTKDVEKSGKGGGYVQETPVCMEIDGGFMWVDFSQSHAPIGESIGFSQIHPSRDDPQFGNFSPLRSPSSVSEKGPKNPFLDESGPPQFEKFTKGPNSPVGNFCHSQRCVLQAFSPQEGGI